MLEVDGRGGENVDEVQPLPVEKLGQGRVGAGAGGEGPSSVLGVLQLPVAQGHDLHLRDARPPAEVKLGDHPAAEDGAAERLRRVPWAQPPPSCFWSHTTQSLRSGGAIS